MAQYDEPEIDFDLDALQAQINMAMAETEELVSSWVQPSATQNQRPKKSMEEVEKELQEYLRRPPRLGVGAPIPESVGPNAQEEAKLKNRLVGNDRKRKREEEVASSNVDEDFDDDEAKKGESNTKITRVDPFNLPKKKMKRAVEMDKVKPSKLVASTPVPPVVNGIPSPKPLSKPPAQAKATDSSTVPNQTMKSYNKPTKATSTSTVTIMDTTPVRAPNGALNPQAPTHEKVISAQAEETNANSSPIFEEKRNHNGGMEAPSPTPISNGFAPRLSLPIMNGISTSTSTASSSQEPSSERQPSTEVSAHPPPQALQDASPSPTTKKKKKKKKKKKRKLEQEQAANANANGIAVPPLLASEISITHEADDTNTTITGTASRTSPVTSGTANKQGVPSVKKNEEVTLDDLDVKTSIHDDQKEKNTKRQDKPIGIGPSSGSKRNCTSSSSSSPQNPRVVPVQLPHPGPPLLNLNGPPPDMDNDNASAQSPISPSKKRRRRHKKKNKQNMSDRTTGVNGTDNKANEANISLNGTTKPENKP